MLLHTWCTGSLFHEENAIGGILKNVLSESVAFAEYF